MVLQILAETLRAALQDLAGSGRLAAGQPRIGSLEEVLQEVRARVGPRRLQPGAPRLQEGGDETRREHQDHQRRGGHQAAVG